MSNFSNRLKELRESFGYTQSDLAEKLNVSRSTIAGYETKGKEPDYIKLKELSNIFNVSIDYLLGKTNLKNIDKELPSHFDRPEDAVKFLLEDNTIMAFGGFDINKMTNDEIMAFANELLEHLRYMVFRHKQKNKE